MVHIKKILKKKKKNPFVLWGWGDYTHDINKIWFFSFICFILKYIFMELVLSSRPGNGAGGGTNIILYTNT